MPRAKKTDNITPVKKTVKKRTVKKTTATRKKATPKKMAVLEQPKITPEIFTLTPSVTHGHTAYEVNHHVVIPKRRPHRNLVITFGVSVIMVIIVGAWILSLKRLINIRVSEASQVSKPQADFKDLKEELDSSLSEMKGQLKKFDDTPAEVTPTVENSQVNEDVKQTFKAIAGQKITMPITPSAEPAVLPN